jgi:hypothetical protein
MILEVVAILAKQLIVCFCLAAFWLLLIRLSTSRKLEQNRFILKSPNQKIIGFFHPAADACGGGEKVLF